MDDDERLALIAALKNIKVDWAEDSVALAQAVAQLRADHERIKALEAALMPFAKAGELFNGPAPAEFDQQIYNPAAGDEWAICGDDLRRARDALTGGGGVRDERHMDRTNILCRRLRIWFGMGCTGVRPERGGLGRVHYCRLDLRDGAP